MANKFQITITAVDKATARVKQIRQQLAKFSAPVTKLKKSFGAFGREVGLPKVAGAFRKVGTAVGDVYRRVTSLVSPMAAIIGVGSLGGLALLATAWSRVGHATASSARSIGISVSELSQLQGAARLTGVSADSLTSSMKQFSGTMEDAVYGRNQAAMAMLMRLGVRLNKTADGAVDSTKAFEDLADAIAAHKNNPQAQNFIASQFGLEALLPMLRKGKAGIEELKRTVRAYGAEMSGPQARVAEAFQLSLMKTQLAADGLWNSIMGKVLPIFSPLLAQLSNWIAANRELIATKLEKWAKDLAAWIGKLDFRELSRSIANLADKAAGALESVGGFKGLLIGIAAITLAPVIGGVLSLAAAIIKLAGAAAGLGAGAAAVGLSRLGALVNPLAVGTAGLLYPNSNIADGTLTGNGMGHLVPGYKPAGGTGNPQGKPIAEIAKDIGSGMLGRPAVAAMLPQSLRAPRGIRNNNPGNLRPSGDQWIGMSPQQTDRGFVQFDSPQAGLRAMAINLRNQTQKHGLDTLRSIISKYAPASENDTNGYTRDVAKQTGIAPDQRLNLLGDPDQLSAVMKAMIQKENGQQPYSDQMIREIAEAVTQGMNNSKPTVRVNMHGAPPGTRVMDGVSGMSAGGAPRIGASFTLDPIS